MLQIPTTVVHKSFFFNLVGLGDECFNLNCPEYSECVKDACNVERCRCELGYANSPDNKRCWKRKLSIYFILNRSSEQKIKKERIKRFTNGWMTIYTH